MLHDCPICHTKTIYSRLCSLCAQERRGTWRYRLQRWAATHVFGIPWPR